MRKLIICIPCILSALMLPVVSSAAENCTFEQTHSYESLEFVIQGTGCDVHQWEIQVTNEGKPFTQLKGEGNRLNNAWVTDMDGDGNPEIILQTITVSKTAEENISLTELSGTTFSPSQTVPILTEEEKAHYQGHDNFTVEDGQIVRTFPIEPVGVTKQIFYQFLDKKLVVKMP
ncbi:hypothetical protein [Beggiatoa leptomitoformis]|uniref:Copper resistance protein NlpE n=1 Tax=Beggiatoa leptomitoformis TaxID=288004 RepID=A0A2N9YFX6_9GAMM|nr:hypothetical protein [Beggiatoa leptomitoformis]ALG68304.1 hypothetical protein AL038_12015 [Beggiatoa leptomitoformis]AUI69383.1 hypothetical protein BLE401_12250 [Beggiatoa leptomitoformis]